MATLQKRGNGHWQARVRTANQSITKTFINKADAEGWAKHIEVELDKGSLVTLGLAECDTFAEIIERYMAEVLPNMRGVKTAPPSGYMQLDLNDPEQLALAILRILPKQWLYDLALCLHGIFHAYRYK